LNIVEKITLRTSQGDNGNSLQVSWINLQTSVVNIHHDVLYRKKIKIG